MSSVGVKLSDLQKRKMVRCAQMGSAISIRLKSSNLRGNDRLIMNKNMQKRHAKAIRQGTGMVCKFSKTAIHKMKSQEGGFIGAILGALAPSLIDAGTKAIGDFLTGLIPGKGLMSRDVGSGLMVPGTGLISADVGSGLMVPGTGLMVPGTGLISADVGSGLTIPGTGLVGVDRKMVMLRKLLKDKSIQQRLYGSGLVLPGRGLEEDLGSGLVLPGRGLEEDFGSGLVLPGTRVRRKRRRRVPKKNILNL